MTSTWIAEEKVVFVHPDGRRLPGRIAVGLPQQLDPNEAQCAIALDGLGLTRSIHGVSTLHALLLATRFLGTRLRDFVSRGGRVVYADDHANVSLDAFFGELSREVQVPKEPIRWTPPQRIRPIAVALLRHAGRLLVMEGRDDGRARTYYRPLGGGIEFGERGEEALRRELREEIGADLARVEYVATIENLYELHGARGHEIVLVYDAELADPAMTTCDHDICEDGIAVGRARWMPSADFVSGAAWLVPEAIVGLIGRCAR